MGPERVANLTAYTVAACIMMLIVMGRMKGEDDDSGLRRAVGGGASGLLTMACERNWEGFLSWIGACESRSLRQLEAEVNQNSTLKNGTTTSVIDIVIERNRTKQAVNTTGTQNLSLIEKEMIVTGNDDSFLADTGLNFDTKVCILHMPSLRARDPQHSPASFARNVAHIK